MLLSALRLLTFQLATSVHLIKFSSYQDTPIDPCTVMSAVFVRLFKLQIEISKFSILSALISSFHRLDDLYKKLCVGVGVMSMVLLRLDLL